MSSQFDATASMLGYLFQVRLALLDSLKRLRTFGSFSVTLETFDDVAFEPAGSPIELLQTKHHMTRQGNLGDASPDLWKSLRVWIEAFKQGRWGADAVQYLMSTGTAQAGTAAAYLRRSPRYVALAVGRLDATVQSSDNKDNEKAYQAYASLDPTERQALLSRVVVVDRAPDVVDVGNLLQEELALVVTRELVASFVTRLEGWWFQRVIKQLTTAGQAILSEEIDAELERLRQQFKTDNLPIDPDLLAYDVIDETMFGSHVFVEQLRLIDLTTKRILTAMRHYFRAFEQRSRWLREGFLQVGELDNYDRRLCEEWDTRFAIMEQNLGQSAAEEAMRVAARKLYEWAELESALFIRPACREPFVSRGSLQMLADGGDVGWHPQFIDRLKHLLEKAS
jgi:hypothetical protein